ncbi:hypothetical protein IQ266_13240 [filamentous cyanobacterium LEGE 11480]|uniref:Uncharacterized protein n=1 Tax=Romeriopsis navalis LEGE 11480 TaxID=2777977 RepID=A0A928Z4Y9_9CYAN|nr:hypothetical protein [Romeriopsis navalis]MBE9030695.1 hypothetical protein [Romeriopsis navalis LEGE 11480]
MSPVPNRPPKSSKTTALSVDAENTEAMAPEAAADAASESESRQLKRPIARPPAPEPPAPAAPAAPAAEAEPKEIEPLDLVQRPIPAPSEPMQYRAIGLVRGTYTPSDEQFTRGEMLTDDGSVVEAVLLGRVMSLVKNHLSLADQHLWVVYPRTRDREGTLHLQVVGVWEPENLSQSTNDDDADDAAESDVVYQPSSEVEGNQFSIRGEIIFYSEEEKKTVVKIQQTVRKKQETEAKMFKLNLEGVLPGHKTIGYFWNLNVVRVDQALTIKDGNVIAIVPPQKNPFKKKRFGGPGGGRRPGGRPPGRPSGGSARPRPQGASGAPKPVKKREQQPVVAEAATEVAPSASSES